MWVPITTYPTRLSVVAFLGTYASLRSHPLLLRFKGANFLFQARTLIVKMADHPIARCGDRPDSTLEFSFMEFPTSQPATSVIQFSYEFIELHELNLAGVVGFGPTMLDSKSRALNRARRYSYRYNYHIG